MGASREVSDVGCVIRWLTGEAGLGDSANLANQQWCVVGTERKWYEPISVGSLLSSWNHRVRLRVSAYNQHDEGSRRREGAGD